MFHLFNGSDLLSPLTEYTTIPNDQLNFIASQLVALVLGCFVRFCLPPSTSNTKIRHLFEVALGIALLFFCFGLQTLYLLIDSITCYLIMNFFRPGLSEKLVLLFSMLYLGVFHTYRIFDDYAGYTLDITGPMMILTQKVTSIAFSYSDGVLGLNYCSERAIKKFPSLLEMLSYSLSFHGIMCGPFCFFNDYKAFIEGNNLVPDMPGPKPLWPIVRNLTIGTFLGLLGLALIGAYHPNTLANPGFRKESSIFYFTYFLLMASFATRCKYYFAWKLADAVNFNAGLGFNGYDDQGHQKWNVIDSVDILKVEFAPSLKVIFDGWNKMTSLWLRHLIYNRTKNTALVFITSAYWHGFYPGYYVSFLGGAFFVILSRMVRQRLRAHFQVNVFLHHAYNVITFAVTKVLISYIILPFQVLEMKKIIDFYLNLYYVPHIIGIALFLILKLYDYIKSWRQSPKEE